MPRTGNEESWLVAYSRQLQFNSGTDHSIRRILDATICSLTQGSCATLGTSSPGGFEGPNRGLSARLIQCLNEDIALEVPLACNDLGGALRAELRE
eukprot:786925-Amphidinium_carterae.1